MIFSITSVNLVSKFYQTDSLFLQDFLLPTRVVLPRDGEVEHIRLVGHLASPWVDVINRK